MNTPFLDSSSECHYNDETMSNFRELPVLQTSAFSHTGELAPLRPSEAEKVPIEKKPTWIRTRAPGGENYLRIREMLKDRKLATVCQEAHCPNLSECWTSGTATIMIGGDTCTRACRFCAVKTARIPPPLDPEEPLHVAQSVSDMGLKYVVLTSVDRDELEDGGAKHFHDTIREIKTRSPEMIIEALVSDFRGREASVENVVDSGLEVYAHNVETVKRLQYRVRDPRAGYHQSIGTLVYAKKYAASQGRKLYTKSSIMLGLGETEEELLETFRDLRKAGVDVLTLGQYLRPSKKHLPVEKFYSPAEFDRLAELARNDGFLYVAAGPMVRSSYRAAEFFMKGLIEREAKHGI